MPVYRISRYNNADYVGLQFSDGSAKRFVLPNSPLTIDDLEDDWVEHVVQDGDTLDLLAAQYAGSEHLWWMIAEVNELIWPLDLEAGTRLIIPVTNMARKLSG